MLELAGSSNWMLRSLRSRGGADDFMTICMGNGCYDAHCTHTTHMTVCYLLDGGFIVP